MTQLDGDTIARRNALTLALGVALAGANASVVFALGGLVGQYLSPDKSLATLPISIFVVGSMLTTIPASLLSRAIGRRKAFIAGTSLGAVAGLVACYALIQGSFWGFAAGTFLAGGYQAFSQYYRFAAADTASPALRPKVISWVLAGGVAAGFVGPQLVIWTRDMLAPVMFAGAFLAQASVAVLAAGVMTRIIDAPPANDASGPARPVSELIRQPGLILAVLAGMVSYSLMNLVMTSAPMAMVACQHTVGEAALGIQWHILAMYGPSFFTGNLIARFGKETVTATGLLITALAGIVALMGIELTHFWGALILLGIGWNFSYVGATAMVTDYYRPSERNTVQAINDFSVFSAVALASFSSGRIMEASGWQTINTMLLPVVGLGLVAVLLHRRFGGAARF